MKNIEEIKKELEELAPTLSGLTKPIKPKVPELYFEGFANRLINNLDLETRKVIQPSRHNSILYKIWWFFAQPRYALASATSVVVIICTMFFLTTREIHKETAMNVSQDEAREYIQQHIDQFDTKSLVDDDITDAELNKMMDESLPSEEVNKVINDNIENLNIEDLL